MENDITPLNKNGNLPGLIACILATVGILTIGTIFVPLAFIVTSAGLIISAKNKSTGGIFINLLAFVLVVIGFYTSPGLWLIFGLV